ncbi:hypothetical protein [Spongiimicrobium salis]|uniref:hypothetical protein n=1 Tax=Spongiimicrobium salis TaxID=1667022 RepID=UPI00374D4075
MTPLFRSIIVLILFTLAAPVEAQVPDWQVNENSYEFTMTLTAFLHVNGNDLAGANHRVAAFHGNEIRGVSSPIIQSGQGDYVAIMTIFSNTTDEEINFRIYDAATNTVVEAATSITFEIDANIGSRFMPLIISDQVLNDETAILDFGFDNAEVNTLSIQNGSIAIEIEDESQITQLVPNFVLSDGAQLFNLEQEALLSGQEQLDFSNPIRFQVRSEDRSSTQDWMVTVSVRPEPVARFYRKNSVCFLNGEIKVEYSIENESVSLRADNFDTQIQPIFEGSTIFRDVPAGTYTVEVGDIIKEITIE